MSVAVVIVNRNCGRYLGDCLLSVQAQTLLPDEIQIVDGHSTDNSASVAATVMSGWLWRWKSVEPHGIAQARNVGTAACWSDWIVPLDADDMLEPHYISHCWSEIFIHADPSVGIIAPGLCWLDTGQVQYPFVGASEVTYEMMLPDTCKCGHHRGMHTGDGSGTTWCRACWEQERHCERYTHVEQKPFGCSMFRRAAWEQVGGYDEHAATYDDWSFWLDIVKAGWRVVQVREALFSHRARADGATALAEPRREEYLQYLRQKHPR